MQKVRIAFSVCVAAATIDAACAPQAGRVALPGSFQEPHSASQHQGSRAL